MKDSLNVAIAGATGYVGIQLIKILLKHPKVNIQYLCAKKSIGQTINKFDKEINKKNLPKISKLNKIKWNKINVLFTALPNGEAQKIALKIPSNVKLIDLSADFRLEDINSYKKWYGLNHYSKKLISKIIIMADRVTPISAPIENSLIIFLRKFFLKTYVLVVLLTSCIIPCRAITI